MKKYRFTGHLSPLPPGVRLPLELSGEVYLVAEVGEALRSQEQRHEVEKARLNRQISKLTNKLHRIAYRRKLRASSNGGDRP